MMKSTPNSSKPVEATQIVDTASLAKYLGLSRWTVSRALNDQPGVKASTRERVRDAVAAVGFEPNRMARGLKGVPSRLVGICFQQLEIPILAQKSAELQRVLMNTGYRGIFELPGWDPSMEIAVLKHFQSIGVDGVILLGSTLEAGDHSVSQLIENGISVVAIDPKHELPCAKIRLDRSYAMEQLIDHLYKLGHRRFALFGFESDEMYLSQRYQGLRRGFKNRGISLDKDVIQFSDTTQYPQAFGYGQRLAQALLKESGEKPTAILALNDRIAMGAIRYLTQQGFRIPNDFSITGFDNIEESHWWNPSVTSVDQNIHELVETAVKCLLGAINGKPRKNIPKIRPKLVIRESTGEALN